MALEPGGNTGEDDDRNAVAQPRSVTCSPNHIRNMVPVTSVDTVVNRNMKPGSGPVRAGLKSDRQCQALEQRQANGTVAGVLGDFRRPASPL